MSQLRVAEPSCVFEASNVGKAYPGVQALDEVNLLGRQGEVIAVCGANGAGKSTLSKLIAGLERPTSGEILLNSAPMEHSLPIDGLNAGVLMMYQEPLVIEDLSVEENLWLFDLNRPSFSLKKRHSRQNSLDLLKRVGLTDVNLDQRAGELSPGQRHMLALARAFIFPHKLLILDETTASINEEHFEILVDIVEERKAAGICIVFVSHKLSEVRRVADTIAVLRDGKLIDVVSAEGFAEEDISAMMIGERLSALDAKSEPSALDAPAKFSVRNFSSGKLKNLSLSVRAGEILGLYGLVGCGRSTFGRAIGGHFAFSAESFLINGSDVRAEFRSPEDAIEAGIGYITEDRHREGFIKDFTNQKNMSLIAIEEQSRRNVIDRRSETKLASELKEHFQVKGALGEHTTNLSGGNQQKVCVSKWSTAPLEVVIFDEPTKGVDVGAKRQIYEIIREFSEKGKAVILISSEAEELMHLSDRALVFVEHEVAAELRAGDFDRTELISIALGRGDQEHNGEGATNG